MGVRCVNLLGRSRLALEQSPVRDGLRAIAMNLQPRERFVQRLPMQERTLRPHRSPQVEQTRLERQNLLKMLDVASWDLQHAELHAPFERVRREALRT